jgi:hypothetical protein
VFIVNYRTRGTECELHEKANLELLEARGGDSTKEGFQVRANALEPKPAKDRKCNVCRGGRMHNLVSQRHG